MDIKEIQKDLSDYLAKKYGNRVQLPDSARSRNRRKKRSKREKEEKKREPFVHPFRHEARGVEGLSG